LTIETGSKRTSDVKHNSFKHLKKSGDKRLQIVGFEVLTAASMKMAVFWVVAPCSLVEVYERFGGTCCLHHQGDALMMEAARTSETLVNFYQTTRCYNPEDSNLEFIVFMERYLTRIGKTM
jgi:hypothetical protein